MLEFKRVPALVTKEIHSELTLDFLQDIKDCKMGTFSLLDNESARAVVEFYWKKYKFWTLMLVCIPYIL